MSTTPERELRADSRPRQFAHYTSTADIRSTRERSQATFDRMCASAERLTPADAVRFAQRLLVHVEDEGIGYADFQSAQAVERYMRKAINALKGLSLA